MSQRLGFRSTLFSVVTTHILGSRILVKIRCALCFTPYVGQTHVVVKYTTQTVLKRSTGSMLHRDQYSISICHFRGTCLSHDRRGTCLCHDPFLWKGDPPLLQHLQTAARLCPKAPLLPTKLLQIGIPTQLCTAALAFYNCLLPAALAEAEHNLPMPPKKPKIILGSFTPTKHQVI